jgi:hypothetical protein
MKDDDDDESSGSDVDSWCVTRPLINYSRRELSTSEGQRPLFICWIPTVLSSIPMLGCSTCTQSFCICYAYSIFWQKNVCVLPKWRKLVIQKPGSKLYSTADAGERVEGRYNLSLVYRTSWTVDSPPIQRLQSVWTNLKYIAYWHTKLVSKISLTLSLIMH